MINFVIFNMTHKEPRLLGRIKMNSSVKNHVKYYKYNLISILNETPYIIKCLAN